MEADGRARPDRSHVALRIRRLGDERARRCGRLPGARARTRTVAALRERGDGRGGVAPRGERRAEAVVDRAHRVGRCDRHVGLVGAGERIRRPRRADARAGRRRRLRARRSEGARSVRAGCNRDDRVGPHRRCRRRRRPVPRRPVHGRRDDATASHPRVRFSVRSHAVGGARAGFGAHRRREDGLGDLARDDARRNHHAGGPGGRRRAIRARDHRAVRQGP